MKTPITYYGGKVKMTVHILPLIPEHTLYCEPFFGGGAIFFAKPPSKVECINDMNTEVINFYRVVQDKFTALKKSINGTLHSRRSHQQAKIIYDNPDMFNDVQRAWAFWVLTNQGFAGQISNSWGYAKQKNSDSLKIKNKKIQFTKDYAKRLELVQIECTDALKVIFTRDTPQSFFYIDPPYFNSAMGHYGGYSYHDFEDLLQLLENIKGKFLLSSYDSELLQRYTEKNGWDSHGIDMTVSVAKGSRKPKREMLTANYPISQKIVDETLARSKSR